MRKSDRSIVGREVPGLAVVLSDADNVLWAEALGMADLRAEEPMRITSICNWFSMTKIVTATAVMQLVERGALDPDAPLHTIYEPLRILEPTSWMEAITVRHLLSHSAGIRNPFPLRWTHLEDRDGPDVQRFVETLLGKHRKLRSEPGSTAAYSNLGFLVLGEVIAAVSGTAYTGFVRENILAPLRMDRTDFVTTTPDRRAVPYQRRFTPLSAFLRVLIPNEMVGSRAGRFVALRPFLVDGPAYGGLVGPADDAARFMQAHLGGGRLGDVRILSEERTAEMQVPVITGRKLEVGLGWFRARGAAPDHVEHLGGGAGFWTCMRIYRRRGLGVVTMGNATSYDHERVVTTALSRAPR